MNALAREVLEDTVSPWPSDLPRPQLSSVQINWDQSTDEVGTLAGPTRFRYARPNASPSYEFEVWLTAEETEHFEDWFNEVVDRGGEVYLPWIGEGRILYLTEYQLTAISSGWKLHALAVQLYVDKDYCDRHVCDGAQAWRVPVIVDADASYPIIKSELSVSLLRPRYIDSFFSWDPIARLTAQYGPTSSLTAQYESADRVIADLGAAEVWDGQTLFALVDLIVADLNAPNVWNGHTLSWFAELTDTITCSLSSTNVLVDIPANWEWDDQIAEWEALNRMIYIDDWETLWRDEGRCRLLKDKLPQPYPIAYGNDWTLTRIIADDFPLETFMAC